MLRKAKDLRAYGLRAKDGHIGIVQQLYFDDRKWTVRYLAAVAGAWLAERSLLISPIVLEGIDDRRREITIGLTLERIRKSPLIDTTKPVSRDYEAQYHRYYNWPPYWYWTGFWGPGVVPQALTSEPVDWPRQPELPGHATETRLHGTGEIEGCTLQSIDGEFGSVEDFIVDDETWVVRYLVVDTVNWWPSKGILVSPRWIDRANWEEKSISIRMHRDTLKGAPAYDPARPLTPGYEGRLLRYYGRENELLDIPRAPAGRKKEPVKIG